VIFVVAVPRPGGSHHFHSLLHSWSVGTLKLEQTDRYTPIIGRSEQGCTLGLIAGHSRGEEREREREPVSRADPFPWSMWRPNRFHTTEWRTERERESGGERGRERGGSN